MRRLLALLVISFLLSTATAQTVEFDQFDRFAASVETSIANDRLPDSGFEGLRASLVEWRETFLKAQNVNAVQIEALQAQLEALGPPPADGETEAASIVARRDALRASLQEARAPQLEAVEAYARADALIGRIDTTLRERQADALLELRRTPLDPTLWGVAATAFVGFLNEIRDEVGGTVAADADRAEVWQRLALAAMLLLAALLLILRGPHWIERVLARIESRSGTHGKIVYGFLVSFGGVLVAMLGVSLISAALISTGILGEAGRAATLGINAAIVSYAVGRWLGGRVFPERESIPSVLRLDARQRASGRSRTSTLGALAGLMSLLGLLNQTADFAPDILGVLAFPVLVVLGLVLFRIGRLVWLGGQPLDDNSLVFANRVLLLLGRSVQAIAVMGPLMAAIGFVSLAIGVLVPVAQTLGLLAFLMSMHYVLRAGFAMLRGLNDESAKQALTPVLISLGFVLAAVPLFALIWGTRSSDLGEAWSRFKAGIRLGEATISPGDILTFAIIFAIGLGITRLVQGTLRSSVLPRTRIDKGGQNAIVSGLGYFGITIAAVAGITAAGIDLSSFAIIIGALGVGIGFGLQNIVNNFVSGIILLIERPIGEGDWVEVNGQMGIVKSISVRSTRIETFDRTDVIVPNGDLISGTVTNWTRGNSIGRIIVPVGVAYGTDTRKVEQILLGIAEANPLVAINPAPAIVFQGFGADSMDFEIRAILTDINYGLSVRSDMNHEIARRFAEEGIEIPFAQRDIWLRNPEALVSSPSSPRAVSKPIDPALGGLDGDGDTD